jgi:sulfide:quinone oxidoreductase
MSKHFQVLIIGGGNAGISVAAKLLLKKKDLLVGIIEPSDKHYYQPAWTLVGGGTFNLQKTVRAEASVIPKGAVWIKDAAKTFEPENNQITCASDTVYTYDYLVAAPGIQLDWHKVKGLKETLGKNGVCSNYAFEQASYTYECIKNIQQGQTAIFTSPSTPVKCGGAPQKIMYLAADYFKRKRLLNHVSVSFVSGGGMIFGVKKYADALLKLVSSYNINLNFKHDLIEIDGEKKLATFKLMESEDGKTVIIPFNMIHVTPPQSAPDFIKESKLANAAGWIDVNKNTLQHTQYANIFALGDATNTPNAKTGAAIRKQAPVLVANILALINGSNALPAQYNGYGSCPLVAGYGKLILAEFDYSNTPVETFPFNQAKPRWSMWLLKKYVLPWMYWNKILKGTA